MATQSERREATRSKLVYAAQRLFVERGFEATSTEDILDAAGASRGSLYHHFPAKVDVFAAVFEKVSREAIERALAKTTVSESPLRNLIEGCAAWLREARRPQVAGVLLEQGPSVLGWLRAREVENRTSLGLMKRSVQAAVDAGELKVVSVDAVAGMINAALAELALQNLHNKKALRPCEAEAAIRQMIEGLAACRPGFS